MTRLVIMTVGKTHSGKTTFAKALKKKLPHSVVIDQDNQAEFLHAHYPELVPAEGPNRIKYALTRTIVDYAVNDTSCHIILCNANRHAKSRSALLQKFHEKGFTSILIHFAIPDSVLEKRVSTSIKPTQILRTALSFKEVLNRQREERHAAPPTDNEANYLFTMKQQDEMETIIQDIIAIAKPCSKN